VKSSPCWDAHTLPADERCSPPQVLCFGECPESTVGPLGELIRPSRSPACRIASAGAPEPTCLRPGRSARRRPDSPARPTTAIAAAYQPVFRRTRRRHHALQKRSVRPAASCWYAVMPMADAAFGGFSGDQGAGLPTRRSRPRPASGRSHCWKGPGGCCIGTIPPGHAQAPPLRCSWR